MALFKCPECGHMISDKAVKCPKCGCPIGVGVSPSPDSMIVKGNNAYNSDKTVTRKWLYAVIAVLAAALLAVTVFLLLRNSNASESSESASGSVEEENKYALATAELGWLNIRELPSTSAKIVGKMRTCIDEADVLDEESGWYKVRFNGTVGYVSGDFTFVGTKEQIKAYQNTVRMPTYKQVMALWEWAPRANIITEEDLSPLADFIPKMDYLKCDIDNEQWRDDYYDGQDERLSNYWACYGMNITDVDVEDGWDAHFSTDQSHACGIFVKLTRDPSNTQVSLTAYFKDKTDAETLFQQLKQSGKWKSENDEGEIIYSTSSSNTKGIEQKGSWYAICIKGFKQKQDKKEESSAMEAAVEQAKDNSGTNYSQNEDLSWLNGNWRYQMRAFGEILEMRVGISGNTIAVFMDGEHYYSGSYSIEGNHLVYNRRNGMADYLVIDRNNHRLKADENNYMQRF